MYRERDTYIRIYIYIYVYAYGQERPRGRRPEQLSGDRGVPHGRQDDCKYNIMLHYISVYIYIYIERERDNII